MPIQPTRVAEGVAGAGPAARSGEDIGYSFSGVMRLAIACTMPAWSMAILPP